MNHALNLKLYICISLYIKLSPVMVGFFVAHCPLPTAGRIPDLGLALPERRQVIHIAHTVVLDV